MLLVLDNCRHVIEETAAFAVGILKDIPDVKFWRLAVSGWPGSRDQMRL
jgi:predicted ATPase